MSAGCQKVATAFLAIYRARKKSKWLMAKMESYRQENIDENLFKDVKCLADKILNHLNKPKIREKICEANKLGNNSQHIQNVFQEYLKSLGFSSEKKGLFKDTPNKSLRPDFFKEINSKNGILIEVERGGTLDNNRDLLDLWKCHICPEANFLFLLVPIERPRKNRKPRPVFNSVKDRIKSFFSKDSYVNVKAVFLFGY